MQASRLTSAPTATVLKRRPEKQAAGRQDNDFSGATLAAGMRAIMRAHGVFRQQRSSSDTTGYRISDFKNPGSEIVVKSHIRNPNSKIAFTP